MCDISFSLCLQRATTFHYLGRTLPWTGILPAQTGKIRKSSTSQFKQKVYMPRPIITFFCTCWKMSRKRCFQTLHMRPNQEWVAPVRMFHSTYPQWLEHSNRKSPCFEKETQFEALNLHWARPALQYPSSWLQALRPLHGVSPFSIVQLVRSPGPAWAIGFADGWWHWSFYLAQGCLPMNPSIHTCNYRLERWRNSHVLVFHGPLLSHLWELCHLLSASAFSCVCVQLCALNTFEFIDQLYPADGIVSGVDRR